MRQNAGKVAHVNPATTGGAFDEVLPLVLRFATTLSADVLARHDALNGRPVYMFPQQGPKAAPFIQSLVYC
jgi:hypothetical protein